jgi:hypothetical protein
VFIGKALMGDAVVFYGEAFITKPMDTSGSARRVKSWLRFAVKPPGANCTALAIANLRFITLIFHQIIQLVEKIS